MSSTSKRKREDNDVILYTPLKKSKLFKEYVSCTSMKELLLNKIEFQFGIDTIENELTNRKYAKIKQEYLKTMLYYIKRIYKKMNIKDVKQIVTMVKSFKIINSSDLDATKDEEKYLIGYELPTGQKLLVKLEHYDSINISSDDEDESYSDSECDIYSDNDSDTKIYKSRDLDTEDKTYCDLKVFIRDTFTQNTNNKNISSSSNGKREIEEEIDICNEDDEDNMEDIDLYFSIIENKVSVDNIDSLIREYFPCELKETQFKEDEYLSLSDDSEDEKEDETKLVVSHKLIRFFKTLLFSFFYFIRNGELAEDTLISNHLNIKLLKKLRKHVNKNDSQL